MRVLDTNVLVRLFVRDNLQQRNIAAGLVKEPFLVLHTVLVELIWVLSSRYNIDRIAFVAELRVLLGAPEARFTSANAVMWALDRYEAGADFADMLHFALAEELGATSFATFDKRIKPHQIAGAALILERLG
jgi:predicted nucleic-acid-binding protein